MEVIAIVVDPVAVLVAVHLACKLVKLGEDICARGRKRRKGIGKGKGRKAGDGMAG